MFRRKNRVVTTGSAAVLAAVAVVAFVPTGADASIPAPGNSVSAATSFGWAGGTMPSVVEERQTAQKLALRFYAPFVTGDTDVLDHVLSEDWIDRPLGEGQQSGREGFKPVVAGYHTIFPDLTVSHQAVIVSADAKTVTVRSEFTGTQKADFLGVPSTGRRITFRTTDVHRLRHGKIVETWHLEDLFGAYQQLTAK
jgi:steroid delta-isomerase-like uncharacterized protein